MFYYDDYDDYLALVRLKDIWEEVGIPEGQRLQRIEVVKDHLEDMLDKMIKEEEEMKRHLQASLEQCRAELADLCAELQMPVFRPVEGEAAAAEEEGAATVLQLEKDLRTRLDLMRKHKKRRMEQLQALAARDGDLCDVLCAVPFRIDRDRTPSLGELDAYRDHVDELDAEKRRRRAEFTGLKGRIALAMADLERPPETSFERDVMCEDEDAFCLSVDNIASLKLLLTQRCAAQRTKIRELWERLETPVEEREAMAEHMVHSRRLNGEALRVEAERLDALKLKNIRRFVEAVRAELAALWDKCFYGEEQRLEFAAFYDVADDNGFTEELLERHEAEALRLKRRYEAHRELFEGVGRWQENWALFRELDGKAGDPSRLHNRGGNLLREQKQRTDLQKSLPKLEKSLTARIDLWERECGEGGGGEFLVGGQPFLEYVQGQWAAFHEEKEREKQERQMKKTKQLKEEAKFGATAAARTPAKRRWLATTPTTAKVQKLSGLSTALSTPNATALSSGLGATVCHSAKKGLGLRTAAGGKASHSLEHSKENAPPPKNTLGGVKSQEDLDYTLDSVAGSYVDFARDLAKASKASVKMNSTVSQY
ncbi:hypothetical protein CRUP_037833 [Coryphaenoides rupestris]|nr:hypothetical protein CRUP_037833 [Coryphaenoides rupestris]